MMPFILWVLGLFFIFLEFYTPGAIMATIGAILLVSSFAIFVSQVASPIFVILFAFAMMLSVGFVIKFALWKIPRTRSDYSIYSKNDQHGYRASSFDVNAIGKEGIASTDLRPSGYITIDGVKHAAISQNGYVLKGDCVLVIEGDGETLIVQLKQKVEKC